MDPHRGSLARPHRRMDSREIAQLDDPQAVRLYRLISEIGECEPDDDDPRLEEVRIVSMLNAFPSRGRRQ